MIDHEARAEGPESSNAMMFLRGLVVTVIAFVVTFALAAALGVRGPLLPLLGGAGAGLAMVVDRYVLVARFRSSE